MTGRQISELLSGRTEEICQYLLPGGKRIGQEYCIGSTSGEQGQSLKVHLSGGKAGLWSDFSTGEKGDLISLWMAVRNLGFVDAMREIRGYLGIAEPEYARKPKNTYVKPKPTGSTPNQGSPVLSWLSSRGLNSRTISAFQVREKEGAVIFPYIRDGVLFHEKYRMTSEKKFWSSKETEPILFGWQALPDDARSLVICEGEIDAMSLHQYGFPALSIPYGAGQGGKLDWIDSELERLDLFEEIILSMDMDEAGQSSIPELVRRLGRERCKVVRLPRKDANECLMAGLPSLDSYFASAQSCDPEGLHPSSEFLPEAMDILLGKRDRENGFPLPWCPDFVIRPSELTIWNGINGHGKSSFLNHLTVEFLSRREKVLYCSFEMNPDRLLVQILRQICGDQFFSDERLKSLGFGILSGLYIYIGKKDRFEAIRYAIRRYGVTQIVIDNLTRMSKMDDYSGQQEIVEKLANIKDELKVHIHLITHARKGESESLRPDKFDVRGAGPITDIADNVVTIHRNKEKKDLLELSDVELLRKKTSRRDVIEQADAKLYIQKQRVNGWEGSAKLWFDPVSCQFSDRSGFKPVVYDLPDMSGW